MRLVPEILAATERGKPETRRGSRRPARRWTTHSGLSTIFSPTTGLRSRRRSRHGVAPASRRHRRPDRRRRRGRGRVREARRIRRADFRRRDHWSRSSSCPEPPAESRRTRNAAIDQDRGRARARTRMPSDAAGHRLARTSPVADEGRARARCGRGERVCAHRGPRGALRGGLHDRLRVGVEHRRDGRLVARPRDGCRRDRRNHAPCIPSRRRRADLQALADRQFDRGRHHDGGASRDAPPTDVR